MEGDFSGLYNFLLYVHKHCLLHAEPECFLTAKKFLQGILGNLLTEEYTHTFNAEYESCQLNKGLDCKKRLSSAVTF